ncbi:MAG: winged helix-turn-helix domain-containing protein [Nitrospira sp.]|nr:winged helix-turn-helix domain-containing protein [Nitrospira sp.]
MLPLLQFTADDKEHSLREAIESLSTEFGLTEEEKKELLPSGQQPTFENRVRWARTYLVKSVLLEAPRRGFFRIIQRGRDILVTKTDRNHCQILGAVSGVSRLPYQAP